MPEPVLVDERVRGDRDADRQSDRDSLGAAPQPAHEHDSRRDEAHAADLARRDAARQHDRRPEQHEHRGRPARDRIDDRELPSPVRRHEQREVRALERGRRGDVRRDGPRDRPGRCRDRRIEHDREREHDRRPRLDVVRAAQEHVPRGVEDGCGQRERERFRRHARGAARRPRGTLAQSVRPSSFQRPILSGISARRRARVRRRVVRVGRPSPRAAAPSPPDGTGRPSTSRRAGTPACTRRCAPARRRPSGHPYV